MKGVLQGKTVLDLTTILAGPYCTMLLGDMGANVIKIERPGRGDGVRHLGPPFVEGESAYFLSINRNKRSITLDLKSKAGKEVFSKLLREADVVVENYRPGVTTRLGIGYEDVRKINDRLIYCSISGYGQDGPAADLPAFDHIMIAYSGWMSITGTPEIGPLRPGPAIGDQLAGIFGCLGIAFALLEREKTGQGQWVETSLLESLLATMIPHSANYLATGENPIPVGNNHPTIVPYASYRASDGYFNISVGTQSQWNKLCAAFGRPELETDSRFSTNADRQQNRSELDALINEIVGSGTLEEWITRLKQHDVPCAPIHTLDQVFNDPQVAFNGSILEHEHAKCGVTRSVKCPVKLSDSQGDEHLPPPMLGEHSEEILREFDFTSEEIETLRNVKAI